MTTDLEKLEAMTDAEWATSLAKRISGQTGEVWMGNGIEQAILVAMQRARKKEREACSAYCLDRADQYDTNSGCWPAVADCAEGIAKGEAAEMVARGETEDLLDRVRKLAWKRRMTPKVDPKSEAVASGAPKLITLANIPESWAGDHQRAVDEQEARDDAYYGAISEVVEQAPCNGVATCEVTGHPCGSDTWSDAVCPCLSCRRWILRVVRESTSRADQEVRDERAGFVQRRPLPGWWNVWCEREGERGSWRNREMMTESSAKGLALVLNERQRGTDSLGWRYTAMPYDPEKTV